MDILPLSLSILALMNVCPHQVFGVVRCPLYTLPNGLGFPGFLKHQFIGNSRQQLLASLARKGLLSQQEIDQALRSGHKVSGLVTSDEIDY